MYSSQSSGYSAQRAPVMSYSSGSSTYSASPILPHGICRKTCISMGKCTCRG